MARMHARRRGKSGSVRPHRDDPPAWSTTDVAEIEQLVIDLNRKEKSSAEIGTILRDQYAVPDVKLATGRRIVEILEANGLGTEIPEDLRNLIVKALGMRKHLAENRNDVHNKRQAQPDRGQGPPPREVLRRNEAAGRRLGLQARDGRDPALAVTAMTIDAAAERMARFLGEQPYVEVWGHHDADGITAASLVCHALWRRGLGFRLRVADRMPVLEPGVPTLLCDLGAGIDNLPAHVAVIDHHAPAATGEGAVLNPHLDGSRRRTCPRDGRARVLRSRTGSWTAATSPGSRRPA